MSTRIRVLGVIAAAAALTMATASCSSSSDSGKKGIPTITVAVASGDVTPIPNGIIQLGVVNGAFDKLGIHVKLVKLQGSAQTVQALVSDQADVANVDSGDAIKLVSSKQLDVRAFVSSGANPDYVMAARNSVKDISDLKGKVFAGEQPGSQPQLLLGLLLAQHSVNPSGVKTISLGKPIDRVLAVINKRADATIVSAAQWASLTDKQKSCCHLLLDEGQFISAAPVEAKVNVATTKTIKKKSKEIQLFTTALVKLSRQYHKDPDGWATSVAKARSDLTLSALKAQSVKSSFVGQWCVNGCMNGPLLQSTSDLLYKGVELEDQPTIPVSAWTDLTFLTQTLKDVGVESGLDTPTTS